MNIVEGIFLGFIQGITEFLPISSSGHLVIAQNIMGLNPPGNMIEVATHLGTLISVIFIYKKDIITIITDFIYLKNRKFVFFLIIGTIPSVIFGLGGKSIILTLFESTKLVSVCLIITGLVLLLSIRIGRSNSTFNLSNSFLIGLSQAFAIIPGISRSGMTITTGMMLGIPPKEAARFSFLLAIPVISGAGILTAIEPISESTQFRFEVLLSSFLTSFLVGLVCLKWLLKILNNGKFHYFGFYCIIFGIITIIFV